MKNALKIFSVIMLAVTLALPAYAEVQNIKVSGDMTVRAFLRQNYDMDNAGEFTNAAVAGVTPSTSAGDNEDAYFMHSVGVNILADLTDNVGVTTRIVNQRDWDSNSAGGGTYDADLDLAYVTLKEFFYAPLTVSIGRQDLWYGKGFIVGAKLMDFNGSINANEYTETAAFDAIKATIDLNPWIIDLAYSKVDENTVSSKDDLDLYVVNLGHRFDKHNAESDVYLITKIDKAPQLQDYPTGTAGAITSTNVGENTVYTLGTRGSMDVPTWIVPEATVAGEIAHQSGDYNQAAGPARHRDAWALDVSGEKKFSESMWKPKVGMEYIMYSGENSFAANDTGDWQAWDPMFRGKFDTAIREFQNYYYATRFRAVNTGLTEVDMDSGLTNEKQLIFSSTIYPAKKVTVKGAVTKFWLDEPLRDSAGTQRSTNLGHEIDVLLTYDYSNDLAVNLLWGTFFPGKYWLNGRDTGGTGMDMGPDRATDIVGSVKLTF